eukprot:TRINITY_DN5760_c0_g1_i12.p1 TRINITY_DN5760_c0_g1~~TRINITY_DN5760_c0_g1_i12.p1  ORF type:complete len:302 (-),score=14.07 TRINITY_DN5760_c0_g1_i12:40-945(-)
MISVRDVMITAFVAFLFFRLENKMDRLEAGLVKVQNTLDHDEAIVASLEPTLVRIHALPGGDTGNAFACGNLVRLAGKSTLFVLTSAHVLLANRTTADRCLRSFTVSLGDTPLPITAMYMKHPERLDLALLEVRAPANLDLATVPLVSQSNLTELQHLAGLCLRGSGRVAVHGRVMELGRDKYEVQTDMGGTHGFSGCGYFSNRELMCVHQGEGRFTHSHNRLENEFEEEYSAYSTFRSDLATTLRAVSLNASDNAQKAYLESLERTITFISRNPRTRCIQAHYAYELQRIQPVSFKKCLS